MIKRMKHIELNISIATASFEYANFKDDLIECKCLCCNKNYQHKFDKKLKDDFLIHTSFLTSTVISLFSFCEKGFILMNIWMIGKIFYNHLNIEDVTDADYAFTKDFLKVFK